MLRNLDAAMCALASSLNPARQGKQGWTCTGGVPTADVCTWYGVICDRSLVTRISLSNLALGGTIPSRVGEMTWLTSLTLRNLKLSGSIPSTIGSLSLLTHLDLQDNSLSNTLPSALFNLSTLIYLSIANNTITGSLPSNIESMQSLTALSLSSTRLGGILPAAICKLNLESISFLLTNFSCVPLCALNFKNISRGSHPICYQSKKERNNATFYYLN